MRDVGLYDSDTGESLKAEKVVDVGPESALVYTRAKRGRIVQLQQRSSHIHYFLDEEHGQKMMDEDSERFGFAPGELRALAIRNAPLKD